MGFLSFAGLVKEDSLALLTLPRAMFASFPLFIGIRETLLAYGRADGEKTDGFRLPIREAIWYPCHAHGHYRPWRECLQANAL